MAGQINETKVGFSFITFLIFASQTIFPLGNVVCKRPFKIWDKK